MTEQDFDETTTELSAAGWIPARAHPCGCDPDFICGGHQRERAKEQDAAADDGSGPRPWRSSPVFTF